MSVIWISLQNNQTFVPIYTLILPSSLYIVLQNNKNRSCRYRMIVGITTTCAISAYNHYNCELEPRSWQGVLDTTFCEKVCQ